MSKPNFVLRQANWPQDTELLRQVREVVFVAEQGVLIELEWDDQDALAFQLLALHGQQPIGTARLLPDGRIGRMAVLKDWRGQGVGTALLQRLLKVARQRKLPTPYLDAQVTSLSFYQSQGFREIGEIFEEASITHQRMVLNMAVKND